MALRRGNADQSGGRPRLFSDDDVFAAVGRVLARDGYRGFSLRAITRELGCSRQTLIHRFGTTDGLLAAFVANSQARSVQRFADLRTQYDSPLQVIRARLVMPAELRPDEIGDPRIMAGQLAYALEATLNDELRPLMARQHNLWIEEYATLIAEAIEVGELLPTDAHQLARQLYATAYGAAVFWVSGGFEGTLADAMEWALDLILAPWMPAGQADART